VLSAFKTANMSAGVILQVTEAGMMLVYCTVRNCKLRICVHIMHANICDHWKLQGWGPGNQARVFQ